MEDRSETNDRRQIVRLNKAFLRGYPARFRWMLRAWREHSEVNQAWMMYAASYLFNTQGVRWAMDPLLPGSLLPEFRARLHANALKSLSFVVLTHYHADHIDHDLLASLSDSDLRYVVPEHMRDRVVERAGLRAAQVLIARSGERLVIDGIHMMPFDGLHWRVHPNGQLHGTDATGYLVEVGGRRWLFPGDVRDYRADVIARFGPVDVLFAHLWLGKARALDPEPPELDAFCDFILAGQPRRVVLTHLYEFSRPPRDLWTLRHVELVRERWRTMGAPAPIEVLRTGQAMHFG